jgi:hypothetical protein
MKVKEISLPVIRLENNWLKKSGRVRTQRTTHVTQLILVDPVEVDNEEIRPRTDLSSVSDLVTC